MKHDRFLKNTLPEITEWVEHNAEHGTVFYSSGSGFHCPVHNCIINKNPRSIQPLYDYYDSKG